MTARLFEQFTRLSRKSKCVSALMFLILMFGLLLVYWSQGKVPPIALDNSLKATVGLCQSDESFLSRRLRIDKTFRAKLEENSAHLNDRKLVHADDWSVHDNELFVYSAYIDISANSKGSNSVKLVSIVRKKYSGKKLYCALKFYNNTIILEAVINVLPHGQNRRTYYYGAFIKCQYSKRIHPTLASLSWSKQFSNWTIIQFKERKIVQNSSIAVCVRPMYGDFISLLSVAEFISFYQINRVDKFVFYNHSGPSYVKTYLDLLAVQNYSIEVLPWTIPFKANYTSIHEYGQILQIQDCIFRYQYKFKYVVNVDLDEFIVPRVHRDLKDLIQHMTVKNPYAGSFIVSSAFFCSEFIPPILKPSGLPLLSTNAIWRESYVWEARKRARTKWIILPERVNIGDIHTIIEHVHPYKIVDVPNSMAFMHHYRGCDYQNPCKVTWKNVIVDEDLLKYKKTIEHSTAVQVLSNFHFKENVSKTIKVKNVSTSAIFSTS